MLSIIIITLNEEKVLPRLLRSIQQQDFKGEYEIIISDANSTDKTRKIAEKFNCKIVDGGLPAVGRNNGAKIAKGKILLFLDADSVLPNGFLTKNIKEFYKRRLSIASAFNKPLSKKKIDKFLFFFVNYYNLFLELIDPHAGGICIFVKKSLFLKVHGFNEKLALAEDHDFVKRCSKFGKFRILKEVPILGDVRRLEHEGRLNLAIKYFVYEIERFFVGELKKPPLKYDLLYRK